MQISHEPVQNEPRSSELSNDLGLERSRSWKRHQSSALRWILSISQTNTGMVSLRELSSSRLDHQSTLLICNSNMLLDHQKRSHRRQAYPQASSPSKRHQHQLRESETDGATLGSTREEVGRYDSQCTCSHWHNDWRQLRSSLKMTHRN